MSLPRRVVLTAGAAILALRPALSQPVAPPMPDDARQVAQAGVAMATSDVGADIDRRMQDFMDKQGFTSRKLAGTLFVAAGKAPVQVTPGDPDWVKYRVTAYEKALIEAQITLVSEQSERVASETILKFTKNDTPPPAEASTPARTAEIVDKILAVAGGRLDKELRDLGIDPAQYQSAAAGRRTKLLEDSFRRVTTRRAIGDTIGLCPVKTFEGNDESGQYYVGVVIVASPAMRDFARQVSSARGEFTADPSRAQDLSVLWTNEAELLADFGVRRLFDSGGLPVIVSFGQWASTSRGPDPAVVAAYAESAKRQAEAQADGQLADFLKGSLDLTTVNTTGAQVEIIGTTLPESGSRETIKSAIDEEKRTAIRRSSGQFTGLTTLRAWSALHPASKTPVIGVIRMWSAAGEKNMRAMMAPAAQRAPAPPSRLQPGATESRQLMKAEDF